MNNSGELLRLDPVEEVPEQQNLDPPAIQQYQLVMSRSGEWQGHRFEVGDVIGELTIHLGFTPEWVCSQAFNILRVKQVEG